MWTLAVLSGAVYLLWLLVKPNRERRLPTPDKGRSLATTNTKSRRKRT
jgi:hypothetical protein